MTQPLRPIAPHEGLFQPDKQQRTDYEHRRKQYDGRQREAGEVTMIRPQPALDAGHRFDQQELVLLPHTELTDWEQAGTGY